MVNVGKQRRLWSLFCVLLRACVTETEKERYQKGFSCSKLYQDDTIVCQLTWQQYASSLQTAIRNEGKFGAVV